MLFAIGVIVWCWGLLSHTQMHRHQAMLKSRCCVLFSDLKVFLLRPPAPAAPPPTHIPMNGQNTESHANGVVGTGVFADNNNTLVSAPQLAGSTVPPTGGAVGLDECRAAEGWPVTTTGQPGTLDCSSSSDDCSKEKSEEGFSLTSCTDSGFRTPLCRICFQGPEQVCIFPCVCICKYSCMHACECAFACR